jgi:hypothetical protein
MDYWHPQIPRSLPEPARIEYNAIHAAVDAALEVKAAIEVKAEVVVEKKVSKKKVSKKT